jgi:hypothetical protein
VVALGDLQVAQDRIAEPGDSIDLVNGRNQGSQFYRKRSAAG